LKDIANYKLTQVQGALTRLDAALVRLETVAAKTPAGPGNADALAALSRQLAEVTEAHAVLKETAGKVAARLDTAITRLSSSLED
jgi:hypothetical protein